MKSKAVGWALAGVLCWLPLDGAAQGTGESAGRRVDRSAAAPGAGTALEREYGVNADALDASAAVVGPPAPSSAAPAPAPRTNATARPAEPDGELSPMDAILTQARFLMARGNPQDAVKILLDGFRINPDHTGLRLTIGLAQCQAGRYDAAIYILDALASEQPQNAYAHAALGTAHFGLGRFEAARRSLLEALRLQPSLHQAHYSLAQWHLAARPPAPDHARRHYREALRFGAEADPALEQRLK
jgi:tetratricopeptide (TPR) repeat protein